MHFFSERFFCGGWEENHMLDDAFRIRYKTIPLAIAIQENIKGTVLHNHLEFEILLITSGEPIVEVNDKAYHLKAGDMIFINPLEIHSVKLSNSLPSSLECICFDASLIADKKIAEDIKSERLHIKHFVSSDDENIEVLRENFKNIIKAYESESKYADMEITAYVSLIFAHLLKNSITYKGFEKSKNARFCAKVIAYISENYSEDITSADVAFALSYNQSYFCRNFKNNFGKSFSDYLNMYRLSLSRKFLQEEKATVIEIAHRCGFNSHAYFSKCFKKHFGVSPSVYKG